MMVDYVDAHQGRFGVEPICAVLPIAPSTYYAQKARECDPTQRPERARLNASGMRIMPFTVRARYGFS
jgi:hypothetical protein